MGRLVILGLDGLSTRAWQDLVGQGVMPHSEELFYRGNLFSMRSSIPEVSSVAWTSIVTGQNPGGHNVYGFTDLLDGSYTLGFTSSRTVKARAFWRQDDGLRNLVMNVPQTYPASPMNGVLVAGYVALDLAKAVQPPEVLPLLEACGYAVDAEMGLARESRDRFYGELVRVLRARAEALDRLWAREAWDRVMFVVTGGDRLNHHCFDDYENADSLHHSAYLDFWREADAVIGRVAGRLTREDALVILSDHGFERQRRIVNVNRVLSEHGYLRLEEGERPAYGSMRPETRAFAMDPGRIYFHRQGRYPRGSVGEGEAAALEAELVRLFLDLEAEGSAVARQVLRGREIYRGPYARRAPDLVLVPEAGVGLSARLDEGEEDEPPLAGKHTPDDAVFFYLGPRGIEVPQNLAVEDVLEVLVNAGALSSLPG
ncbi:MAG: alkaline phosphatase family protein [Planctomycetota bacterium]